MLSKQMYTLLSCLPRDHSALSYKELERKCSLSKDEMQECFCEVDFMEKPYYRRTPKSSWYNSDYYISELGLAEIEDYEQSQRNNRLVQKSLIVAIIAMIASIASAVAAFISVCG